LFWVEIWVNTPDTTTLGVAGASVDVYYDTSYLTAMEIQYGPAFTENLTGTIDDALGLVGAIGGTTAWSDVGDDGYVLLARVRFGSIGDDQVPVVPEDCFLGPYDMGMSLVDGQTQLVGAGAAVPELGGAPETELWAVMYDFGSVVEGIAENNLIDFGDLGLFAPAFAKYVGPPQPPYTCWADFDKSGLVDFGDLSFFAPNFAVSRAEVQSGAKTLVFPPNFPADWRASGGGDEVQGEWFGDGGAEGESSGADGRMAASFDGMQPSQKLPQETVFGADEDAAAFRLAGGLPDVAAFGRPEALPGAGGRDSATDAMFAHLGSERQERNERWTAPGLVGAAGGSVAVERAQRFQRLGGRWEPLEDVLSLLAEDASAGLPGDAVDPHDALFAQSGR
jgi:hypothetical protein